MFFRCSQDALKDSTGSLKKLLSFADAIWFGFLEGTCGVLDHSYSVDILTCVQLFSDLQRCFLMITDVLEFSLLDVLYILSNCSLDVF